MFLEPRPEGRGFFCWARALTGYAKTPTPNPSPLGGGEFFSALYNQLGGGDVPGRWGMWILNGVIGQHGVVVPGNRRISLRARLD